MRRLLHIALILSIIGTGVELGLLGHYEDAWQWIPIILLSGGLVISVWHIAAPSNLTGRILTTTMLMFIISGLVGTFLHVKGNMEFELEMYPGLEGLELIWKTLRGALPALAPGTMIYIGLVGLIAARYKAPSPSTDSQD